jgi:hypothetical protein
MLIAILFPMIMDQTILEKDKSNFRTDLTVKDTEKRYYNGVLDILGTIENHGRVEWRGIEVKAEFYGEDGKFLDVLTGRISANLLPGASDHFKITAKDFPQNRWEAIGAMKVKVSEAYHQRFWTHIKCIQATRGESGELFFSRPWPRAPDAVVRPHLRTQGDSTMAEANGSMSQPKLRLVEVLQVAALAIYCAAAVVAPLALIFREFDNLFSSSGPNPRHLFAAMILTGVLGSALRGLARLLSDVGERRYEQSWSLSIVLRPFEGAGIAFVSYLAISAGLIVLEQGRSTPNAASYLFFGVLSGMFSHRAADKLRGTFDKFLSGEATVAHARKRPAAQNESRDSAA